ncbi:hypothetical protein CU097_006929, partial [Rhizopus azygosporus]
SFQSVGSAQLSIPETPPQRHSSLENRGVPPIDNQSTITTETAVSVHASLGRTPSLRSISTYRQHQQQMIEQQRHALRELEVEKIHYVKENQRMEEQLVKMQEKIRQRTEDMKTLKNNYQLHLQSMRCSDDDPESIANRLRDLRATIKELANELLPYAEPKQTTEKLSTLWLNLGETIGRLGNPYLSLERIQLLTEKFMMDVLVQNLNTNHFPGLSCHQEFLEIQDWFDQHDSSSFFATRLRQEVALLIVNNKTNGEDIEKRWKKSAERHWYHLYRGLQKSYPKSFLAHPDKEDDQEHIQKQQEYSQKLRDVVEKAMNLGSAIKGQEVCITAMDVKEGVQQFDPLIMEDEDGQTSGIIALCISPPFVVKLTDRYEPLVKGRVLCFPNQDTVDDK